MDMIQILAVLFLVLLVGWSVGIARRRSHEPRQGEVVTTRSSVIRVAVTIVAVIAVGALLWVAGGKAWLLRQLERATAQSITFPVHPSLQQPEASVSLMAGGLRLCNKGSLGWQKGMMQINDKYVADLPSIGPGKCAEVAIDEFMGKNWKKLPAGSPAVYKCQIHVSSPVEMYGQFPLLSSRPEKLLQAVRPECLPQATSRNVIDWSQFHLPESGSVVSPYLRFRISEAGAVSDVRVVASSGSPEIDRAARDLVSNWKYQAVSGCGDRDVEMQIEVDADALKGGG